MEIPGAVVPAEEGLDRAATCLGDYRADVGPWKRFVMMSREPSRKIGDRPTVTVSVDYVRRIGSTSSTTVVNPVLALSAEAKPGKGSAGKA